VQDQSEFKRRSHKQPRASHRREATLTVSGFTAGGSGMVSTEAITINTPRTQIMHDLDFIPACVPNVNDNNFPALSLCDVRVDGQKRHYGWVGADAADLPKTNRHSDQ
jgi:hypothetical protein